MRKSGQDLRGGSEAPVRAHARREGRRRRGASAAAGLATAAGLAVVAAGALAWATGWRAHDMTTPSMGTAAPVGSLVISRPVSIEALHPGQIVVFHPPGQPTVSFAHRVYSTSATTIRTRGDLNPAPDTWALRQSNLVGRVVAVVPDAGYVMQLLPWLILGALIIVLLTSGMARERRGAARILGWSLLVAALLAWFHPLANLALVSQEIVGNHGRAAVAPTGMLPLSVQAVGGNRVNVSPGQVATVFLRLVPHEGAFRVNAAVHLYGWWWLTLVLWAVPLFAGLRVWRRGARSARS